MNSPHETQPQVMSSGKMASSARVRDPTQEDIGRALCTTRTLVKTSCAPQTLHLLTPADFPFTLMLSEPAGCRATQDHVEFVTSNHDAEKLGTSVVEAPSSGSLTKASQLLKSDRKGTKGPGLLSAS